MSDFEDLSSLLQWNELQKVIYGKRLLKGSAKRFVTYERSIQSWNTLKRRLSREFKTDLNSALVHKELTKRKRQANEMGRQYVHTMQEIISQGHVETEALIQHIIDDVQNEETNKTILHGASTLHNLKKKFEIYDRE